MRVALPYTTSHRNITLEETQCQIQSESLGTDGTLKVSLMSIPCLSLFNTVRRLVIFNGKVGSRSSPDFPLVTLYDSLESVGQACCVKLGLVGGIAGG